MRLLPILAATAFVAAVTIGMVAEAQDVFAPAPPGTVVQSQPVHLTSPAMHSQWRAVVSRKLLGSGADVRFYQWYLSIYEDNGAACSLACSYHYGLKYQSPANGGPLSTVTQPKGATIWFPVQQLRIVSAAEFMQSGIEELVVESHAMSADCGVSTVAVLSVTGGKVVPAVSVRNGCELSASIVGGKNGLSIDLSGPYYGPNAAMCCPTKPHATAVLGYSNGKWSETPNYYPLYVGKFPPN